ncbi:carbohydrate ABC transporter permease [Amphiplicatus metriothermophilus]|uniref:carbohydrate ABC transporter permease n=1 Tax=Amphiplicatus metriothermophilus TaxID=1519374 RepID=UPI0017AE5B56|nr:sugar ABC transporter permease [Amphiplicatus metriothermophilus]MBB5519809.1 ABC-type sugar transport system permease subunit [Amphiplicatus metriothermophilus]
MSDALTMRPATPAAEIETAPAHVQTQQGWANLLFVAPYLAAFALMIVIPLAMGLWLSTTKSDLFGVEAFIGLLNFIRLLRDPIFLQAVWNTLYFVLLTAPTLTVLGFVLALALNRQTR